MYLKLKFSYFTEDCDSEVWNEDCVIEDDFVIEDDLVRPESPPLNEIDNEDGTHKNLNAWLVKFLSHFQSLFHLSDKAMEYLIKFLAAFLLILGRFAPICLKVADQFPQSLHQFYKGVQPTFMKYVTCRRCHRIYSMANCIEGHGIHQRGKECGNFLVTLKSR